VVGVKEIYIGRGNPTGVGLRWGKVCTRVGRTEIDGE